MKIIEVQGLTKIYKAHKSTLKALENVSFSVNKGEFVAESFPTVAACIIFYSCVEFLMLPQFIWVTESLATLFTYMRCFSSVKPLVTSKG